jgi:cell division septation protein DedD
VPRLRRAWRSRVSWYPGDWIWPSLLALVIAALAGSGAAAFVAHDKNAAPYVTATSAVGRVTSTISPPTRTTQTTAPPPPTPGTTQQQQPPPPPAAPAQTLKVWPASQAGWTIVLQSLPTANGRAFALAQARAALHSGLTAVGILDSSQYSSLHPGYYVLFSGVYTSSSQANAAVATAQSHGYPRAYPRRITP